MKKISIIIPIYNSEPYLERCLKSIKEQSYCNFEAIMINDGSTDNSSMIAERYSNTDKRFVLFNKKNEGVSSARNYGIIHSSGDWVTFVDSDDWIEPKYCEHLLNAAKDYSLPVVGCRRIDEYDDHCAQQAVDQIKPIRIVNFADFIPTEQDFYGTCWGYLFKSELCKAIRFDTNISFGEDALFTVEVLNKAGKFGLINLFDYHYNLCDHKSLSQGSFDNRKFTIIDAREKQVDLFKGYKGEQVMRARLADACLYIYSIGHKSKNFSIYYSRINLIFKKNFKYWNKWKGGGKLILFFRKIAFRSLKFGYPGYKFFAYMRG